MDYRSSSSTFESLENAFKDMKNFLLACAMLIAITATSVNIPKKLVGQYDAEVPAFEFKENGEVKQASGFLLSILLRESSFLYRAGSLEYKGVYNEVNQNGSLVDMQVTVSNSASLSFDLDFVYDKKSNSLAVYGIKGLEQVNCEKKEVVVEKNKRFRRL